MAYGNAQSASSTSASQHAITGREMSKILPKPELFRASTREQECSAWPSWLWSREQYLGVLDPSFAVELAALKMSLSTPASATMPDTQVRSRQLYAMLAVLIKGRGFFNGYEALRHLIELYAPQSKSRSLGILTALTQVSAFKSPSEVVAQSSPTPVRGAWPKSVRRPVMSTMSPGAHDTTSNPGSLSFHMPLAALQGWQAAAWSAQAELS